MQESVLISLVEKNNIERSGLNSGIIAIVKKQSARGNKVIIVPGEEVTNIVAISPENNKGYLRKEAARNLGSEVCNALNSLKESSATLVAAGIEEKTLLAFAEGILLTAYQFDRFRANTTKGKTKHFSHLIIGEEYLSKDKQKELHTIIDAVFLTRDLVNRPLSDLKARQYGQEISDLGKKHGFQVTVLDKKEIEQHKMGGILAVNKGSVEDPVFIIMEYKPAKPVNKQPLVLIGKGVMYDTGGLSLKPTQNSMDYMKCDMGGSAAVLGGIIAISDNHLPVHIIGLIPAVENRPGGDAFVPGDVIRQYDGTTVEIMNTDAEGRLILADALSWAKQYSPSLVMDFATLTGSAARAIGQTGTVFMGTASKQCRKMVRKAGKSTGERMVKFPLWDEFREMLDSEIADIKNLGTDLAGASSAGRFLQHFTDYPWLHFDIAGPAFIKKASHYRPYGATGVGVRFIYNFTKKWSENVAEARKD